MSGADGGGKNRISLQHFYLARDCDTLQFPALMATKRKVAEKKEVAPKKQAPAAAEATLVDGVRSASSFLTPLR